MDSSAQTRKDLRREQEIQRRRQEIMNAARILFVEKGFRNTTLDEIADAAAFGKGTLYNYFANKDDLFLAIVHQQIDESNEATVAAMKAAPSGARDQLYAYTLASISHFQKNNEVFLMIMREHNHLDPKTISQFTDRYEQRLSLVVEPLKADLHTRGLQDVDLMKLALLFDGMIRTYFMSATGGLWTMGSDSPTEVSELIVSIFFDGIENKKYQG